MIGDHLTEVLQAPSLCEHYRCRMQAKCAQGLACAAFARWAENGKYIDPRLQVPASLGEGKRKAKMKKKHQYEMAKEPLPTEEIFSVVMGVRK